MKKITKRVTRQCLVAPVCALVLTGGLPATSYANPELDALKQRASEAAGKINGLMKLGEIHGRYQHARDVLLAGESGLQEDVKAFSDLYHLWNRRWDTILDLFSTGQVNSWGRVYGTLMENLRAQERDVFELQRRRDAVHEARDRLLGVLDKLPPLSRDELGPRAPVGDVVREHIGSLRASVNQLVARTDASYGKISGVAGPARQTLLLVFKKAALQHGLGEINAALRQFEDLLAFEREVEPLVHEITGLEHDINAAALFLRVHTAERLLQDGRVRCGDVQVTISNSTVRQSYKDQASGRVNTLCDAMEDHVANLLAFGFTRPQLLNEYVSMQRARAVIECGASEPTINCEKAHALSKLNLQAIEGLSVAQREFVENAWNAVLP